LNLFNAIASSLYFLKIDFLIIVRKNIVTNAKVLKSYECNQQKRAAHKAALAVESGCKRAKRLFSFA
jgi:hypothetical protein